VSLICCSCTERGKAHLDTVVLGCGAAASWYGAATGSVSSGRNREGLSTVAGCAGGPTRSSGEASVMGVERRGWVIYDLLTWSTGRREELRG
jgi:hypothetical protein